MKIVSKNMARENQKGSVLFTTILILFVVNLLVIGLLQTSARESRLASFKTVDSEVFHITDSCVNDSMRWLGDLTSPPSNIPYTITENNLSHMYTGTEGSDVLTKLSNYSYSCTTTDIAVKAVSGDSTGSGDEIGESSGYGAAGDLSPRYYYQVVSTGLGPQNSTNTITATVSLEF